MRFLPTDEGFFGLFDNLAERATTAARLLTTLFEAPERRDELTAQIKAEEHAADQLTYEVMQRLDRSFVTPLDREDIHRLAKRLDNVIDLINGASRRVVMFRVTKPRDGGVQMADVIVRASKEILASVGDVTKRQKMMEHGKIMKQLEEEGDVLYAQAVGALFDQDTPAIEVLKWKELFDSLEQTIDECEDVSNVLESIALKNS